MHSVRNAVMALALVVSVSSVAMPPGYHPPNPPYGPMNAVYFLRVDPAGSSIVAVALDNQGKLMNKTSSTRTGGVGLQSRDASAPGEPVVAIDPLQAQDAVTIGDDFLFTVNSGSNTVVMMGIDPIDPLQLHIIGSPVSSLGSYPMAVTYSVKLKLACVLNGGSTNGVACYHVNPHNGLVPDGKGLRKFGYDFVTPPVLFGPKGSGSDIQFTPDSSKLIAVSKGDAKPATLGHINVFNVGRDGLVAQKYTAAGLKPLTGTFGFAFDTSNPSTIFVTDATFGGGLISLNGYTNHATLIKVVNDTADFVASCWTVYAEETGKFYNLNAGSPVIGQINSGNGALEKVIKFDKSLKGALDAVVEGSLLYFLTGINEIAVMDLNYGKIVQTFSYASAKDRPFWTGMAMYKSKAQGYHNKL